jgi:hypothetical protein
MTVPPVVNDQQLASVSHARRRNRDYKRDASLDLAKQQFMSTVDAAINNLMQNCGYSRSRAISALLHEFRREVPPPTDDEVRPYSSALVVDVSCCIHPWLEEGDSSTTAISIQSKFHGGERMMEER